MSLYETIKQNFTVIAGPCVIESEAMCLDLAHELKEMCDSLGITYIFKASFDKANRTSLSSYRGPGLSKGLEVLGKVREMVDVPVTTDFHESWQAKEVAKVVDILQIPAFLCRQTDMLLEAGNTGRIVNIKKAQFLTGDDMIHPAVKVASTGNEKILLTERGSCFGANNLVVDYSGVIDMMRTGYPVVMDVTHSTQRPGGQGNASGGDPQYAPYLAGAAASCGVKTFFMEVHPNPAEALSDAANCLSPERCRAILLKTQKQLSQ